MRAAVSQIGRRAAAAALHALSARAKWVLCIEQQLAVQCLFSFLPTRRAFQLQSQLIVNVALGRDRTYVV